MSILRSCGCGATSGAGNHGVNAQMPWAVKKDKKKYKAVHDRRFAVYRSTFWREEAAGEVKHEISDGHLATRKKSRNSGEQTEGNQESSHEFDPSADQHNTLTGTVPPGGEAENFLAAVTGEEQADNEPHDAINCIRVAIERVHGRKG